jgi:hypothetical protein
MLCDEALHLEPVCAAKDRDDIFLRKLPPPRPTEGAGVALISPAAPLSVPGARLAIPAFAPTAQSAIAAGR